MSKWQIDLYHIGRGKVNQRSIINADSLLEAEEEALRECKDYLVNRDVWLRHLGDLIYNVLEAAVEVGKVRIKTI